MIKYYKTRPTPEDPNVPSGDEDPTHRNHHDLSEFDKHRESLLSDDLEEGWASLVVIVTGNPGVFPGYPYPYPQYPYPL